METEFLDKAGLNALWAKINNTYVRGNAYSNNNNTIYSRLAALEKDVQMLKVEVADLKNSSLSGGGSTPSTPTNIPTLSGCSVSGNNAITVTGVSGDYTLAYIDSNGNILSNYENITI